MIYILIIEEKGKSNEPIYETLVNTSDKYLLNKVSNRQEFIKALENNSYDLVIADNNIKGYDGLSAFEDLKNIQPELPFLLCSTPLGEDKAIQLIKKGITDYVTKNRLDLLPEKIEAAALRQKYSGEEEKCKKSNNTIEALPGAFFELQLNGDDKLQKNENFLQLASEAGDMGFWDYDIHQGILHDPWFSKLLGNSGNKKYLTEEQFWQAMHPEDIEAFEKILQKHLNGKLPEFKSQYRIRNKKGKYLNIVCKGKIVAWDEQGNPFRMVGTHLDITQSKKAEEALENLSIVAKNTHNGVIITDAQEQITWVNKSFTKITGYNLKEVIGKKPNNILQGKQTSPKSTKKVREKLNKGKNVTSELINYRKNGDPYWVRMEITPVYKYGKITKFIAILSDITRKKKDEHQLKLLEKVVESSNDGVLITNAHPGNGAVWPDIIYANKACRKITGFTPQEMKENPFSILIGKETDKKVIQQFTKSFENGKILENDILFYKKNKHTFWANFYQVPIKNGQKEITHFIFIMRDVTHQKLEDMEKRQMINNLRNYNHALEQYAFITSHNLRAPIARIIGLTNLIQSDINQTDFARYTQYLQESARDLDKIIKDLNYLLNIRNNVSLAKTQVDIEAIVQKFINNLPEKEKKAIGHVNYEWVASKYVLANQEYMDHILYKLLENCVKFRKKEIPLEIFIKLQKEDNHLVISLTDNGIGFDAQTNQDKIFRPYQHFNTELKGNGLGLSIAKAHVDALGGKMEVDSQEGKGTTFRIVLPQKDHIEILNYAVSNN